MYTAYDFFDGNKLQLCSLHLTKSRKLYDTDSSTSHEPHFHMMNHPVAYGLTWLRYVTHVSKSFLSKW